MTYNTLPYTYEKTGTEYKRLIVEPFNIPTAVSENGLISPERESKLCEMGHVVSAGEGSIFQEGDEVFYNKIDRNGDEHIDTVEIDGKVCDVIYENEVWCRNEQPIGRVFVEAFSEIEANESGVVIPKEAKGITQKGRVVAAPEEYNIKVGDLVEFRKQEQAIFNEVVLNEMPYLVLFEADIFKVNGKAAPYRMIVKIDIVAQQFKQQVTKTGVALSPLFKFMLRNLQYAEVLDIGDEAAKMYPEVKIGDTLIIHHAIEHQEHRLVAKEYKKPKKAEEPMLAYEHRVINCWDPTAREFFGKMTWEKKKGKIIDIVPLNGSVFLKWDFNMLETKITQEDISIGTDITKYHNLDDFRNVISHKKSIAAEKAKQKVSGIRLTLQQVDPNVDKELYDSLESELHTVQREETKLAAYINRNHMLVCKRTCPATNPPYVIASYEELYPIHLLGEKFLIANDLFLYAQTTSNMNITSKELLPLGDNVIVKPIVEEEKDTDLLIPVTAKEKPCKGTVVAIDDHPKVKTGDTILFRKAAGLEQDIDEEPHLIMKFNDMIAVVPQQ